MLRKICVGLILMCGLNAVCQVEPSATGGPVAQDEDVPMSMPPPVSGTAYPTQVGSAVRENYLSLGLAIEGGYSSNVLPGLTAQPISDEVYSFFPLFRYDQQTPRQTRSLSVNSGYTFYQHTSGLDNLNQGVSGLFQQRLTRHVTLSLNDTFAQTSGVFNQPGILPGETVSGSVSASAQAVIAPYANELLNSSNAVISDQFSQRAMVGGSFVTATLNFPDPSQAVGLDNTQSYGGTGFLNRRFAENQYAGAIYEYLRTTTDPVVSTTEAHAIYGFLTHYFNRSASLSLAAGPEYLKTSVPGSPAYQSWTPAANASLGWQAGHANLAASYARTAGAAQGLPGAFSTDTAGLSAAWRPSVAWSASVSGGYAIFSNLTPQLAAGFPGGHTVNGSVSVVRAFGEHFNSQIGYIRLHESYTGIPVITANPDSDEVFATITYQLRKPIGR